MVQAVVQLEVQARPLHRDLQVAVVAAQLCVAGLRGLCLRAAGTAWAAEEHHQQQGAVDQAAAALQRAAVQLAAVVAVDGSAAFSAADQARPLTVQVQAQQHQVLGQ